MHAMHASTQDFHHGWQSRSPQPRALGLALTIVVTLLASGCGTETTDVSSGLPAAADSAAEGPGAAGGPEDLAGTAVPAESTVLAAAVRPGIVFGTFGMEASLLGNVHTGTLRGGGLTETTVGGILSGVRAKGGRIVLKLCNGKDSYVKNSNGTFSLTKWKGLVDRYKRSGLDPYIADGTIVGHFLIDEPHRAARWGGQAISAATLEAMAAYSKQLWPGMITLVGEEPTWLSGPTTFRALDAGWAQYTSGKGDAAAWVAKETAAARNKGLGLAVGINVLDGGNGSSGIRGLTGGKWAMGAAEIRKYGSALLDQSYACAFFNWMYDGSYYGRSDIKSAMADLSPRASSHQRTSCQQ